MIKRVWVEHGEGCSEEDIHSVRKAGLFCDMVPNGVCKFKCVKCADGRRRNNNFTI